MEWFKFRTSWMKPMMKLTKEEAGEVIQALLKFIDSEEEPEVSDKGDIMLCMMIEMLKEDICQMNEKAEKKEQLRKKRSEAGKKSGEVRRARSANAGHDLRMQKYADGSTKMLEGVQVCSDLFDKNKEYKNTEYQNTELRNSETEKEERCSESEGEDGGSSSVPPPAVTELPVLTIPMVNGSEHPVFREDIAEYVSLYPDIDVEQELRNMRGWCLANPTRRKTKKGVRAFINSWLSKSQKEYALKREVPENPFLPYARGEKGIGDLFEDLHFEPFTAG